MSQKLPSTSPNISPANLPENSPPFFEPSANNGTPSEIWFIYFYFSKSTATLQNLKTFCVTATTPGIFGGTNDLQELGLKLPNLEELKLVCCVGDNILDSSSVGGEYLRKLFVETLSETTLLQISNNCTQLECIFLCIHICTIACLSRIAFLFSAEI